MKPTLFYTLKRHRRSGGFEVLRVTTAKTNRYYGSTPDGDNTHVLARDCTGRFDNQAEADVVVARVQRVRQQHAENHVILTAARNAAEQMERMAIEAVIAGENPDPLSSPISLVNRAQAKGAEACRKLVRLGKG